MILLFDLLVISDCLKLQVLEMPLCKVVVDGLPRARVELLLGHQGHR